MSEQKTKVEQAGAYLKEALGIQAGNEPQASVILGSGLGAFAEALQDQKVVEFSDIPGMPKSTVAGHGGRFVYGKTQSGLRVLAQQGRVHFYEGYDLFDVTFPIRLHNEVGSNYLVITTSVGTINEAFKPGEFMMFTDHINAPQLSPLSGLPADLGERFVDMSAVYDSDVIDAVLLQTKLSDYTVHTGTFVWVVGPCYETPAEIKAFRTMGGDVVSMSTVPEVMVARQRGMKINGIANITNYGSGIIKQTIEHGHVADAAGKSASHFIDLLEKVLLAGTQG